MKKKTIAVSLITAMVVCNSMTVWAADTWSGTNQYTKGTTGTDNADRDANTSTEDTLEDLNSGQKDVKGNINLGSETAHYSVTISWGDMTFTKDSTGISSQWLTDSGYYQINGSNSTWTSSGDTITVTNRSNVGITATFTVEDMSDTIKNDYGIIEGSISVNNTSLPLAKSTSADGVTGSSKVTVAGKITKAASLSNSDLTLGTVTVKITSQ